MRSWLSARGECTPACGAGSPHAENVRPHAELALRMRKWASCGKLHFSASIEKREKRRDDCVCFVTIILFAGCQGVPCSTSAWICSHISKCQDKMANLCSMCVMLCSLPLPLLSLPLSPSPLPLVGSRQLYHSTASSIQQEGTM